LASLLLELKVLFDLTIVSFNYDPYLDMLLLASVFAVDRASQCFAAVRKQGGNQLISALADLPANCGHRYFPRMYQEGLVPGDNMGLIAVDQRPVNIKEEHAPTRANLGGLFR
jgi:hypothetical protein